MSNRLVLKVFAPVLLLAGVLGFVLPPELSLTSGATPYNVFHLVFGAIGLAHVVFGREQHARAFNLGFGLIDLYQALASFAGWFPAQYFLWKTADDVLHVVIGLGLVLVGLLAGRTRR